MSPFSVEPHAGERPGVRTRSWRVVVAWMAALLVIAVAATWFWVISIPGTFVLTLVPFLLVFAVSGFVTVVALINCATKRRSVAAGAVPWPAVSVVAVLVLVVVGTRTDLSVRVRFELHRDTLTTIATTSPLPPATEGASTGLMMEIAGYGSVDVVAMPGGGTMIVTGGEGAANGFVYLPDTHAVDRWPGPTALRPLGGGWYLTV